MGIKFAEFYLFIRLSIDTMYIWRQVATGDQHLCEATALKMNKNSCITQLKIQEGLC